MPAASDSDRCFSPPAGSRRKLAEAGRPKLPPLLKLWGVLDRRLLAKQDGGVIAPLAAELTPPPPPALTPVRLPAPLVPGWLQALSGRWRRWCGVDADLGACVGRVLPTGRARGCTITGPPGHGPGIRSRTGPPGGCPLLPQPACDRAHSRPVGPPTGDDGDGDVVIAAVLELCLFSRA